jgi:hypothetical protein
MVKTPTRQDLGDPEDWPVADTPPEAEQKGLREEDPEQRETGDDEKPAPEPEPTGREGLAGK